MNYMSGLPATKHVNNCIFVVVNRFLKMAIMANYKKNITAKATAKLFFERVWVYFWIPQSIISDRDNMFLSTFFFQPLVNVGHQAHQVHNFPSPN